MRRILRALPLLLVAALFAFAVVGCGGGDSESASDTTTAVETTEDVDTTADVDTTEDTGDTEDVEDVASADDCRELTELGAKLSQIFTGTGSDLGETQRFMQEFADRAPEAIREDFQVLADAYTKIAETLGDDFQAGQTPSPETLQKLQQLQTEIDQQRLTEASNNISKWVQENCKA